MRLNGSRSLVGGVEANKYSRTEIMTHAAERRRSSQRVGVRRATTMTQWIGATERENRMRATATSSASAEETRAGGNPSASSNSNDCPIYVRIIGRVGTLPQECRPIVKPVSQMISTIRGPTTNQALSQRTKRSLLTALQTKRRSVTHAPHKVEMSAMCGTTAVASSPNRRTYTARNTVRMAAIRANSAPARSVRRNDSNRGRMLCFALKKGLINAPRTTLRSIG